MKSKAEKQQRKINETKSWVFQKINTIDKIKKTEEERKSEGTQE